MANETSEGPRETSCERDSSSTARPERTLRLDALVDALIANAPGGFAVVDREFRYLRLNEAIATSHATSMAAHLGRTVQEVLPDLWGELEPFYRTALDGGTVLNHPLRGIDALGKQRSWLVSYYPVRDANAVAAICVVVNDVTEQVRMVEALERRTNLYAMLSRTNRAVSQCKDRDDLYREICSIAVEIGCFRFAFVGVPDRDRVKIICRAGDDRGYTDDIVISLDNNDPRSHGPTGRSFVVGEPFVVNDFEASAITGPWKEKARLAGFAASAAFPLKERGKVVASFTLYAGEAGFFSDDLVTTLSEITPSVSFALDGFLTEEERRRDEATLRMLDRAIHAVSQGIVISDARLADQPIVFASPGFEAMTGYSASEILGKNCRFLQGTGTDRAAVEELRNAIREQRSAVVEIANYRKDGTQFWNHLTLSPVTNEEGELTHFVGVQSDVTDRKNLEAQFRQSQKMEAVGKLAGGVAHDFNNLLSVILSYTTLLLEELTPGDPMRADLEEVRLAGQRASELTRQLLAFSRQQVLQPRVLDISTVILGTEKMLRRLIGADIELSLLTSRSLHRVLADPGQIEQVVMNLVVNARDAMPRGGKITIETTNTILSDEYAAEHHGVVAGHYVMIAISDTGIGMPPEIVERIFEPFFTTKPVGKGTGLGLSTVFGIVKQSQGHIWVYSEPSVGTTFKVYFPATTRDSVTNTDPRGEPATLRGNETILLVEDEEQVRTIARTVLRRQGYNVLEAANGGEAFLICEKYTATIHLLLTDVVMPRMSGRELVERLKPMRPEMRVLFVSGYAEQTIVHHGVLEAGVTFLQKPITPDSLIRKVRQVLDAP